MIDVPNVRLRYFILFSVDALPVNVLEKVVLLYLFSTSGTSTDPSLRIPVQ
jgi:hypothetical protein